MTSAAASCPFATRALSIERALRTRFASRRACTGCELAAGLVALIDFSPGHHWNSTPELPLSRGDRGGYGLSAALAALHGVPGPAPVERRGSRALRSRRLARGATARAADLVPQASLGGLPVASATWPELSREACPHASSRGALLLAFGNVSGSARRPGARLFAISGFRRSKRCKPTLSYRRRCGEDISCN